MIIDEAAAIPLPLVKALLGPYLVFMASTINGYEGTGRNLSLKLLDQLRQQSVPAARGPSTQDCSLYYINRDTLFSYHSASEAFLHRLMALFVASHYKNSPNDLQLLSDAPGPPPVLPAGPHLA